MGADGYNARSPRPLWRWWLFCVALDLWWRTGCRWNWLADLYSWCVLPEWLGDVCEIHDGLVLEADNAPF